LIIDYFSKKKSMRPLFTAALLALFASSCTKVPINLPGPPSTVLKSLEKFPFKDFLDSAAKQQAVGDLKYGFKAVWLTDMNLLRYGNLSQAELALSFRANTPATITSLALLLPSKGYSHTVTLWDSATGTVLAQTDVPSLDSGRWTSVNLAVIGKAIAIKPGKAYIVGFNSMAVGSFIGAANAANQVYNFTGIYYYNGVPEGGEPTLIPILPFTNGAITYETGWEMDYDNPINGPIFPGKTAPNQSPQSLYGLVDIGYVPLITVL
jgi:hypothetical protein